MKDDTRSFYEAAVERAVRRIIDGLDDALHLAELSRLAALSPFHFHRVFRGMVGETPLELHRRLRMERAAYRLGHEDASVTAVAFEAGYDTHEAFSRAFRAAFGVSPSAFRQRVRAAPADGPSVPTGRLATRSGIHFRADGPFGQLLFHPTGESIMNVTIKQMPSLRLGTVRHVGPYPGISEAFARLGAIAGPAGLFRPDAKMVALYVDDPETTPAHELRSDAALSLAEDDALPASLTEARLPAGRHACATHIGSYAGLPDAWARLMGEWLPKSTERVGEGTPYEIYVNNPMTASDSELHTELYVRLA